MSKPKKPAKKKQTPKQKQKAAQQRQARARANYKKLREAGFSAKEAERYRYSTDENINQVIMNKYLPPVKASKQGALKPKIVETPYNNVTMKSIELRNVSRAQIQKAFKLMNEFYKEGFTYFNIVVTYRWELYDDEGNDLSEEQSYTFNPEKEYGGGVIEQGAMIPVIDWIRKRQKEAVIELEKELAAAVTKLGQKYAIIEINPEAPDPVIIITINMWKAN